MTATDVGRTFDIIVAGRGTGVRFDIPWAYIQSNAKSFNWTTMDNLVNAANSRNLFILGSIVTSPRWAAHGGSILPWTKPRSAAEYAEFCAAVANRYRGKIDAYELWNEPNGALFFMPGPDAAFYTEMVKAAYPRIKSVDPAVTVVAGALAQTGSTAWTVPATTFLQRMYESGLSGSCDAVSFHPYDWGYSATFAESMRHENSSIRQAITIRRLMQSNGDGTKRVWASEFGAPTSGSVSQQQQANFLVGCLQQWQEVAFGGPMFIHTMRDKKTGSSNAEDNFGVVTTNYTAKTALYGIEGLARGGFPKRGEYDAFAANADAALGAAVGPVYRQSYGWAQERESGTRFATNHGFLSSPTAVANYARAYNVIPLSPLNAGMQDMDVVEGFRVFTRQDVGTHAIFGAILAAWTANMGFPTTDHYTPQGTNKVVADFERARITWTSTAGTSVQWLNT